MNKIQFKALICTLNPKICSHGVCSDEELLAAISFRTFWGLVLSELKAEWAEYSGCGQRGDFTSAEMVINN